MPAFDFHFKNTMKTCKEGWMPKNWCFCIVVLDKTPESALDCEEIKPVNPKGNWIFIRRADAEAEAPILWPPDVKSWLVRKTLMLGKIEGKRRRGRQKMRWLDGIIDSNSGRQWSTGKPSHGKAKSWTRLSNLNNSNSENMYDQWRTMAVQTKMKRGLAK